VINFDDPRNSHRCNPLNPDFMTDISDAYEAAYTIMLNLNRSWIQKQGDSFVESPIILLAAIIWYLKIYEDGKYCTFPHAIELLNKKYSDVYIYSAALGLYNSRIVKLINKNGQLKSSVIIDELPTIYFRGLDNLIATARSNKVAVCLGFQDFSQLTRDYGDKESKVIQNTVGNIFSGQVVGETTKSLSERYGKVLQKRQSMTINRNDKSTSISTVRQPYPCIQNLNIDTRYVRRFCIG
jgi:hypothetical protein